MKRRLRREIKAMLAAMPPEQAAAKGRAACGLVLGLPGYQAADAVMAYWPMPGELDDRPIALAAWQAGKTVLMPRANWAQRDMAAVAWDGPDGEGMTPARHGALEPINWQPWPLDGIDFIVVPGLAYDRRGNRLGRGGGFYDRFLARPGLRAITCGLAFAEQLVEELPVHPSDYPVDILVTDREVIRFPGRARGLGRTESTGSLPAPKEADL